MTRRIVNTSNAPAAIGPYSQAIIANSLVFTAGQIAIDPTTGNLVSDDVVEQTQQVIANLAAVLESAGASLQSVVKTTIFLTNLDHFTTVNAEYAKHFSDSLPARSTVVVSRLPKDALVEIEAVATLDTV